MRTVPLGLAFLIMTSCADRPDIRPGKGKKILIAHRGASAYAPEHTLAAYRLALEQGADFVEQDLQFSKDGVLLCLHDRSLERTTDVEQVFPGRFREVEEGDGPRRRWFAHDFTLEEIKRLDAGAWFDKRFAGQRVPTFQEAIDLVRGRAGLFPEIKEPAVYRDLGFEVEAAVLETLRENGLESGDSQTRVILQTFDADCARRLAAEHGASFPVVLLIGRENALEWANEEGLERARSFAAGIGPNKHIVRYEPKLVQWAHRRGLTVTPYTFRASDLSAGFDTAAGEMAFFLEELGVDGLFTDNPDLFPR